MLILAGDIGGTTTRLAFFRDAADGLAVVAQARYASREHGSLAAICSSSLPNTAWLPNEPASGLPT